MTACTTLASLFGSYDDRSVVIQTFDLFDQRRAPAANLPHWQGDWVFRRERLAAVDSYLRTEKPDVLVFQGVMARLGSPSEDDLAILGAGALVGFETSAQSYAVFEDTQEQVSLAVATSLPVSIAKESDRAAKRAWPLGESGYMTLTILQNEGQPISLFNIMMPDTGETDLGLYEFMYETIATHFTDPRYCVERVVVAGFIPSAIGSERLYELFERLDLQDVAEEECGVDASCYTRSTKNGLARLIDPNLSGGRTDKILVKADTLVYSASRSFDNTLPTTEYIKSRWNLAHTWPSTRFGWSAEVKFPRCPE